METATAAATFAETSNYGAQIGVNSGVVTNNFQLSGIGERQSSFCRIRFFMVDNVQPRRFHSFLYRPQSSFPSAVIAILSSAASWTRFGNELLSQGRVLDC
jgi:hypothetical protein